MTEAQGSFFFYLSYAPSVPPAGGARIRGDYWVKRFFADLESMVAEQADLHIPRIGFCDLMLPLGADRHDHVRKALAASEVFVPLYSPAYLDRMESISERESFRRNLMLTGQRAEGHIQPVLWKPLLAPQHFGDRDHALDLAPDIDEYAGNGMSVLCQLDVYTPQYRTVLTRLAQRIGRTARRTPLRPGTARPLVEVARPAPSEVPFRTAVLAPTTANLPPERGDGGGYGPGVEHWRPFPGAGPVVADLVEAVERLGLHPEVREFLPDAATFAERPGVLLVDPWILATDGGAELVRAAAASVRPWAGVAIVTDPGSEQARTLLDQVHKMLRAGGPLAVFTEAPQWRREVPELVERLRRRYLSHGPSYPPDGPVVNRPRLSASGPVPPVDDTSGEDLSA